MDLATFFGKLKEHKIKVKWPDDNEEGDKKTKILALKVTNVKDMESENKDCQSESDEDINLMFLKFSKFLRHEK